MLATLKLSFAFAVGAVSLNVFVAEVAQQPVTVGNLALTFSGLAMVWFGGTHIKMRDAINKLSERIPAMEKHFERYATMTQRHELELALLKDHDAEQKEQKPAPKRKK